MATKKTKRKAQATVRPAGSPRVVKPRADGVSGLVAVKLDISLNAIYGVEVGMSRDEYQRILDAIIARKHVSLDSVDCLGAGLEILDLLEGEIEDINLVKRKANK